MGTMVSTTYKYKPLSSPQNIRLLEIVAGDGPVACKMFEFGDEWRRSGSGEDWLEGYTALSYTWGNPENESEIRNHDSEDAHRNVNCDGKQLTVTLNCYDALLSLRSRRSDRLLWIDALCIDQDNIDERNAQVNMMGSIFASARYVIIWLGKDNFDTDEAVSVIWGFGFALGKLQPRWTIEEGRPKFNDPAFLARCEFPPITDHQWTSTLRFFTKSWFGRGWTLQELVLAKRAFVLFEREVLQVEPLLIFAEFMVYSGWCNNLTQELRRRSIFNTVPATRSGSRMSDLVTPVFLRSYGQEGPHHSQYQVQLAKYWRAYSQKERHFANLEHLLSLTRLYVVTDERDKVFAPLALATYYVHPPALESMEWMVPDYTQNIQQVYTNLSSLLLRNSARLSLLSHVEDKSLRKIPGLPSWVADFTSPMDPLPLNAPGYFHATAHWLGSAPFAKYLNHENVLKVVGIMPDSISTITLPLEEIISNHKIVECLEFILSSPFEFGRKQSPLDALEEMLWIDKVGALTPEGEVHLRQYILLELGRIVLLKIEQEPQPQSFEDGHSRYLTLLPLEPSLPAEQEIVKAAALWIKVAEEENSLKAKELEHVKAFVQTSKRLSIKRRLIRTENGYLGFGPISCQLGDTISYIKGADVPFVLRKVANERYELVGEAYIHGYMHGEIAEWKTTNFQDIFLQ